MPRNNWFVLTLSQTFENASEMLRGLKTEISLLIGFLSSRGTTKTVFAKSGKILCSILELINLVKNGFKKSTASFVSFGGMVSIPSAFLELYPSVSFFFFT